jgi:hypothetical protein
MSIFKLIVAAVRRLACPPPPPPVPTEAEIDAALQKEAERRGGIHLNWRESIIDLLTLLDIDSGFHNRSYLWIDLGGNGVYVGSAEQNIWMIQQVRHRFAAGHLD